MMIPQLWMISVLWTLTVIERWDAIIYRNEEGTGAKIAKHPTGQFVKWKDVKSLIEAAERAEQLRSEIDAYNFRRRLL